MKKTSSKYNGFCKNSATKKNHRVKKIQITVKNRGALVNTICHALFRRENEYEIRENAIFSVFYRKTNLIISSRD